MQDLWTRGHSILNNTEQDRISLANASDRFADRSRFAFEWHRGFVIAGQVWVKRTILGTRRDRTLEAHPHTPCL